MIKHLTKPALYLLTASLFALFASNSQAQAIAPVAVDQHYQQIGKFDSSQLRKQSVISIKGNHFVDEKGKVFVFRGVSIADPDKLTKEGQWKPELFEELKNWGVNTVRLPIHPKAWRTRGQADYLKLLDQAVVWANARDMYVIVDWHSIGFPWKRGLSA